MKVLDNAWIRQWRAWFLLLAVAGTMSAWAAEDPTRGPLVGKPAPAFQVQGIYHETYTLDSFKGRLLILQFGASW